MNANLAFALEAKGGGLAPIPISEKWENPAEEKPLNFAWGGKDNPRILSEEEIKIHFASAYGSAVICGKASGGLYLLDFDIKDESAKEFYRRFRSAVKEAGFSLSGCYIEQTVSGGFHIFFRFPKGLEVPPNQKLARTSTGYCAIESRGEGGLAYVYPTPGYENIQGDLPSLAPLSETDVHALIAIAKSLDEGPEELSRDFNRTSKDFTGDRPGDVFNEKKTWDEILSSTGAKIFRQTSKFAYWTRPGKKQGVSAVTGLGNSGQDLLKVFTSNWAPFEQDGCYDKFGAYVLLAHNGSFTEATKAAAKEFGIKPKPQSNVIEVPKKIFDQAGFKFHKTDTGNAQLLVARMNGEYRYCAEMKGWLVWDGKKYVLDASGQSPRKLFVEIIQLLYQEASECDDADRRKELVAWAMKCEAKNKIDAAVSVAMALPGISIGIDEIDSDPWLFNCQSGVIDLRTGELLPHSPERLMMRIGGCEYDPNHPVSFDHCPTFAGLMGHAFAGDDPTAQWLLNYSAYSLTGQINEQCFAFLHGVEQAGKSTFVEVLREIMGDYAVGLPTESLMAKFNGNSIPSEFATLNRARMVICEETEEGQYFAASLLKLLSGNEIIRTRYLYRDWFDMRITFKLWIVGNHRPQVSSFDGALLRRMNVVPFENRFSDETRDKNIKEKLRKELPYILRVLIAYCIEWQRDGLTQSESMKLVVNEYKDEMDKVKNFLDERTEKCESGVENSTKVYKAFRAWCDDHGFSPENQHRFGAKMRAHGFRSEMARVGGRPGKAYRGLILVGEEE